MNGLFITFEGTEGSGKSTQIKRLADKLTTLGYSVCQAREPGGTPIGEEIRHTLKHSSQNQAMTPETELLLMNASRAQLVREVIRPALDLGSIVLCDRFYDSTTVYQGYARGLDLNQVTSIIDFAVGPTRPNITLLLMVPLAVSEERRLSRQSNASPLRDRFEENGRAFFERVEKGYHTLASHNPDRIRLIDATQNMLQVEVAIWHCIEPLLKSVFTFTHEND